MLAGFRSRGNTDFGPAPRASNVLLLIGPGVSVRNGPRKPLSYIRAMPVPVFVLNSRLVIAYDHTGSDLLHDTLDSDESVTFLSKHS